VAEVVGCKDVAVTRGQKVVIVDGVPETAQVLRAVFEPRGHRVERVRGFEAPATTEPGSVLVLHDDGADDVRRRHRYGTVPRVVIGSVTTASGDTTEQRLAQPFQYAELIRAVESLLDDERRAA
jgi:CheY-like chemotaxis protein